MLRVCDACIAVLDTDQDGAAGLVAQNGSP